MAEKRNWLGCRQTHSHNYFDEDGNPYGGTSYGVGFTISWQRGALGRDEEERARNRNGAFVEDVIQACIDRMEFYQESKFACEENEEAIRHLKAAKAAGQRRFARREEAGTEGTMLPD